MNEHHHRLNYEVKHDVTTEQKRQGFKLFPYSPNGRAFLQAYDLLVRSSKTSLNNDVSDENAHSYIRHEGYWRHYQENDDTKC